ncbi:MAG TPA: hypothetical protein VJO32_12600 [Ktedonobacteraceae bacterium]|nr:hypothetical protein [Ktedonobacteraceae bacterium]
MAQEILRCAQDDIPDCDVVVQDDILDCDVIVIEGFVIRVHLMLGFKQGMRAIFS